MVVIDTKFLTLMLAPKVRPRKEPSILIVDRIEDRIEKLLEDLDSEAERIIVPTPVLSEFLIFAGKDSSSAYLEKLAGMRNFLIKPFDEMEAIELAAVEVEDRTRRDKRGGSTGDWAKIRFDRQIVAIARTNRAKRIYSDDKDLGKFSTRLGI